jgi:hypothetical protein
VTERTHDIELFPGCQPDGGAFREPNPFAWRSLAFLIFLLFGARAVSRGRARPKRALSRKLFPDP